MPIRSICAAACVFLVAALGGCGRIGFELSSAMDAAVSEDSNVDAPMDAGADCSPRPCVDPSFSPATISLGTAAPFYLRGLARHRDGYLVLGRTAGGMNTDLLLTRLSDNGFMDSAFGTGGSVQIDLGGTDDPHSVTVGSGDRIYMSVGTNRFTAHAVVLLADGSLDTSFGGNPFPGAALVNDPSTPNSANGIDVDSGGDVYVGGHGRYPVTITDLVISKVDATGTHDTTFGASGLFRQDIGGADEFGTSLLLPTGNLLTVGSSFDGGRSFDCAYQLVSPSGVLVPPYGAPGNVGTQLDIAGGADSCGNAFLGRGNDVFLVGNGAEGGSQNSLVVRLLTSDLSRVPSFGSGGVITRDVGGNDDAKAGAVLPDGRVVLLGSRNTDTTAEPYLWVIDANGNELVPPFVPAGAPSGGSVTGQGLIVDEQGRVVFLLVEEGTEEILIVGRYLF